MTGIQGDINIIRSSVAAITLLDCCLCYLEGIWTHLADLINPKVARQGGGSSSGNGINCPRLGKAAERPLTGKRKLFLGFLVFINGGVGAPTLCGTEQGSVS